MNVPLLQVDAFTSEPFAGNPAAVCLLDSPREAGWMQHVAREMNLPETAFVVPHREQGGFDLRWFTPTIEVDLCGHATLASAHALWESGRLDRSASARFHTRSGVLTAALDSGWIELNFPATPDAPAPAPDGLGDALGAAPLYVGRSPFDYLVEVEDEKTVRSLRPDLGRLRTIDVRGVIVTSRAANGTGAAGCDFVSRFFAPAAGIDEDPVTGSAHCCLAPFWARRMGKSAFVARQVSERGGLLKLSLDGDRVRIAGQAVTVVRGELLG